MRGWKLRWPQRIDLATALLFGALMFALTPLTGTTPARYVLYGWPAFWIFGVAVLNDAFPTWRKRACVVIFSLCVSWTPALVRLMLGPSISGAQSISTVTATGLIVSIALVLLLNAIAWPLISADELVASPVGDAFMGDKSLTSKDV